MMDLLREWDIPDDWRDCYGALKGFGAKEFEAQVAWLLRHHCTNKEIVKVLSTILGRRVAERAVKHELERLAARLRLRGRTSVARRVERLIEEYLDGRHPSPP